MLNNFTIRDMAWSLKNFIPSIEDYEKEYSYSIYEPIEQTPYYEAAQALAIIHEKQGGDIYPIHVFIKHAVLGYFTDYDGVGEWVNEQGERIAYWSFTNMGSVEYEKMKNKGAKYIIWYNK